MEIKRSLTKYEMFEVEAPSATRLIGTVFNRESDFSKIPKHILEEAKERGSWVHEQIENYINDEPVEERWEWQAYMDSFHEWLSMYDVDFLVSEWVIADLTDFTCKGILDCLAYVDGVLCLIDFKTSAKAQHKDWELQLSVYAYLLYKEYGLDEPIELRVVMLGKDGMHKMLYYDYNEKNVESLITLYQYVKE